MFHRKLKKKNMVCFVYMLGLRYICEDLGDFHPIHEDSVTLRSHKWLI